MEPHGVELQIPQHGVGRVNALVPDRGASKHDEVTRLDIELYGFDILRYVLGPFIFVKATADNAVVL